MSTVPNIDVDSHITLKNIVNFSSIKLWDSNLISNQQNFYKEVSFPHKKYIGSKSF